MSNCKYFVICDWMVKDLKLKGIDRDVYAIIYGICQHTGQEFYGSISSLCDMTGYSRQTVITALKKLVEQQLIIKTRENDDGKHTCKYIINSEIFNTEPSKDNLLPSTKTIPPSKETIPNNIYNNKTNNINNNIKYNTKVLYNNVDSSTENNSFLKTSKKPKQSRYDKYISIIDDFMFNNIITDNTEIKELLINHLNMLIEMNNANNKQLYSNQYKGILNKFTELIREKIKDRKTNKQKFIKDSIQQSITKQWVNFFDIKDNNKNLINNSLGESFGYKYDYNLTDEEKEIDYSKKF